MPPSSGGQRFNPRLPRGEATILRCGEPAAGRWFQSAPPARGGDPAEGAVSKGELVSIRASRAGRRRPRRAPPQPPLGRVSIRASRAGRRRPVRWRRADARSFNPRLPRGEATRAPWTGCGRPSRFNPRLPRGEATPALAGLPHHPVPVSIRASRAGRRPLAAERAQERQASQFQSAPPARGGDRRRSSRTATSTSGFQSAPPARGGDRRRLRVPGLMPEGFNPRLPRGRRPRCAC